MHQITINDFIDCLFALRTPHFNNNISLKSKDNLLKLSLGTNYLLSMIFSASPLLGKEFALSSPLNPFLFQNGPISSEL